MQDRALPMGHDVFRPDPLRIRPLDRRIQCAFISDPDTSPAFSDARQLAAYDAITRGLYTDHTARNN